MNRMGSDAPRFNSRPSLRTGQDRETGLGDMTFTALLSPGEPGRVRWGVGTVFLMCGKARTRIDTRFDTNTRDPGIICAAP